MVESLIGKEGWLLCTRAALTALETEDYLVLAGITDSGDELDHAQCRRLFDLPGEEAGPVSCDQISASGVKDRSPPRYSAWPAAFREERRVV